MTSLKNKKQITLDGKCVCLPDQSDTQQSKRGAGLSSTNNPNAASLKFTFFINIFSCVYLSSQGKQRLFRFQGD